MKYCRFLYGGQTLYGAVDTRSGSLQIVGLTEVPEEDPHFRLAHGRASSFNYSFEPIPLSEADLLTPVTPSKIVCVGHNYREHVRELGNEMPTEPLLFFKPPSSLLRPGGAVVLPAASERVDFEGELAIVIGRRTRNLKPEDDWREVVRGFTLANAISARDFQKKDGQWARRTGHRERRHHRDARQRRVAPAGFHARHDLSGAGSAALHFGGVHAGAGRPHPHRNSLRRGAAQARRPRGSFHRWSRRAREYRGSRGRLR